MSQQWMGRVASEEILKATGIRTQINRLRPGFGNRLVVDGLTVYDLQDSAALHAARVAVNIDLLPLLENKIRIRSAQLLSAKAMLYQDSVGAPLNIQHIIDVFASEDTTSTSPIDLQINSIVVRHSSLRYDLHSTPHTEGRFNTKHLALSDINLTAELDKLTKENIDVTIRRLSAKETSGLEVTKLNLTLQADTAKLRLSDFRLALPNSQLSVPHLDAAYPRLPEKGEDMSQWLAELNAAGDVTGSICPADLRALLPALQSFNDALLVSAQLQADNGQFTANKLALHDTNKHVQLESDLQASGIGRNLKATWHVQSLHTSDGLRAFLTHNLNRPLPDMLDRVGATRSTANVQYANKSTKIDWLMQTKVGDIDLHATMDRHRKTSANVHVNTLQLAKLLDKGTKNIPTHVSLSSTAHLTWPEKGAWPSGEIEGNISDMTFNGQQFRNIALLAHSHGHTVDGRIRIEHTAADMDVQATVTKADYKTAVDVQAHVYTFCPQLCGLTEKLTGEHFSGIVQSGLNISDAEHITGFVSIDSLTLQSEQQGRHDIGSLYLHSTYDEQGKHLTLNSQPLNATANGVFHWNQLPVTMQQIAYSYLPGIVKEPKQKARGNELTFHVQVQDTTLLKRLASIPLQLPHPSIIHGQVDGNLNLLSAFARMPELTYGNERLTDVQLNMQTTMDVLHTTLEARRQTKSSAVRINAELFGDMRQTRASLLWDNEKHPQQRGRLAVVGIPYKDQAEKQAIRVQIEPSQVIINDTVWQIQPASVDYHDGRVDVDGLGATSSGRYLRVTGTASSSTEDTLTVNMEQIDLSYIFDIVRVRNIEFDGKATGRIYATNLFQSPCADAFLQVQDFTFNRAMLGQMDIYGNYGNHGKGIFLDANIRDLPVNHQTTVHGTITPGKGEGTGLDLNIQTQRINLAFLNEYTSGIMTNVEGRASGHAHIYGPFKTIDLEGDMLLNEASMHINALGTSYSLSGDSLWMRPGRIILRDARLYDMLGYPGGDEHRALLTGELTHRYLGHMAYDMQIATNNLLSYNQPELGNESFCGTAYTTGQIHLWGRPGRMDVDVRVTPMSGSTLTYNATQPDKLTEASFIRFKQKDATADVAATQQEATQQTEEASGADMHLNFDINVTPESTLKVLMDMRSGDNITLSGNGHLRATYFNKGRFQLYGTYHVEQGLYDMSIQDFLHKEFRFQPGSSIVFGGNPGMAQLNLRAAYTVPNVSLDDLSTTTLGLSNTRVDCIMNIGGQAETPSVTFDFELPTASEEERQMVRSMLSSEEERNMQVIYLLGIGRFFSFNGTGDGSPSQSEMAMNSLLSSTLSSQFNRALSSVIGLSNWNFGTNLRTGQMGWNNVDVEGMLSGRLLNNRLHINGQFGYRERLYNTSNFIGDFDVQYLITPTGTISLKAYNKSNDRYFIQSSLNTQGIGIQLKKDFYRLTELFRSSKKATKK